MPVVVYYGEEGYLLEAAAQKLRDDVVNPAMASLSHRIYRSPSLAAVLEAVGGMSLSLGGQTLIEIRDFDLLTKAAKDKGTETQLEDLKDLLTHVDDSKVILFLSTKIDGKIKFPKWLTKNTAFTVQKFEPISPWKPQQAVVFLDDYARSKGIQMARDVGEILVETLGTDLRTLTNEVDKLALYANGRMITRADAELMCGHNDNVFKLINRWILQETPDQNFRDLGEILLRRHPVETFGAFQSTFNKLFRTVWLASQGMNQNMIAEKTGQNPYAIKNNLQEFRRVPMDRWLKLKQTLVEMEWKSKTGQLDATVALEVVLGS